MHLYSKTPPFLGPSAYITETIEISWSKCMCTTSRDRSRVWQGEVYHDQQSR